MSNIFKQFEKERTGSFMQDRGEGNGLAESPWLIDKGIDNNVRHLSENHDVTPGEAYRYALRVGLAHLKKHLQEKPRQKIKLEA